MQGSPTIQEMEAPPGFEPGMEVLQTSALPLGDGAGRTSIMQGNPAACYARRQQRSGESNASIIRYSPANQHPVRPERSRRRSGGGVKAASRRAGPHPYNRARGAEREKGTRVAKRASRGAGGPDDLINGAGNGIRTRDFDLGKVALYH